MLTEHLFARDEVYPSWFANALGHFLSLGAFGFTITKQDATHIQVIAGANDAASAIAIAGRWRWVEATVTRAHPGGAAGTYDIFVTAADNDIVGVPAAFTDATTYAWALAIVAAGATPAVVPGTVDIFRKVGSLQWDGAQITRIDQSAPAAPSHAHSHSTAGTDPLAPVDIGAVATGGAGSVATLEVTGAGTALTVDHDAAIDGALNVVGNQTIGGTLAVTGASTFTGQISANAAGTGLAVANNATVGGTLGVTGASTLAAATATGLITGRAGLTLDAGAGTVGQTITLTGRNGGAANTTTLGVSAAGALTITGAGGQPIAWAIGAATQMTLTAAGQLQLAVQGNAGGLLIGGDATLYRNAAGSLRTGGALTVDGNATLSGTLAVAGSVGFYGTAPVGQVAAPTQARVNSATNVSGGTAPAALTASSTLGDVIAHVSRVANVLQGLGLLGSGGVWSS